MHSTLVRTYFVPTLMQIEEPIEKEHLIDMHIIQLETVKKKQLVDAHLIT